MYGRKTGFLAHCMLDRAGLIIDMHTRRVQKYCLRMQIDTRLLEESQR